MAYVEWLRARNVVRVVAIVYAAFFVLTLIGRGGVQIAMSQHVQDVQFQSGGVIPLSMFFGFALIVGLIVATIVGAPLARENSRHLELAWMKPVSRTKLALSYFVPDIVCILASEGIAVVVTIFCSLVFGASRITVTPDDTAVILVMVLGPIAWFAMLAAVTSWVKRGFGTILGLSWPAAVVVPVFAAVSVSNHENIVIRSFHNVMQALQTIDPFYYFSLHIGTTGAQTENGLPVVWDIIALAVLAIVYGAIALIEWNRIEAR